MKLITYELGQTLPEVEANTACIGYFDGLHMGHQALIEQVVTTCRANGTIPTLITFEPDPWQLLKGLDHVPQLLPMQERIQVGAALGIQQWIILRFNQALADLSCDAFISLLSQLQVQHLVCGFDFRFGKKGQGDVSYLREHASFQLSIVEKIEDEHTKISTTFIEQLIEAGEITRANRLLQRAFYIRGMVIHGNQKGRGIGFPTANVEPNADYVIPQGGVYIGQVTIAEQLHHAIINIGNNPTFNYRSHMSIEVHILDFDEQIYGQCIKVEFLSCLRKEIK
ncbi:MAG: riboflavin biosynthesis protein RibF, partial [Erysipelotrichaceae bacterium]